MLVLRHGPDSAYPHREAKDEEVAVTALAATAAFATTGPVAAADPPTYTGDGIQGKGATVFHCSQLGISGNPVNGVLVYKPFGGSAGGQEPVTCIFGAP